MRDTVMAMHDAHMFGGRKTLEGIVRTNSIGCVNDVFNCILCAEVSRFNHSCTPNCEQSWDDDKSEEHIYASADISAGEELCISYVDVRAPRDERLHKLQDTYRFECQCSACKDVSTASDQRRMRLQEINEAIGAAEVDAATHGVQAVTEMLELCDQEHLRCNGLRAQACYHAFQCLISAGDVETAVEWVKRAHRHSEACRGRDHAETLRLCAFTDPDYF